MWTLAGVQTNLDDFFWTKNDSNYLDIKLKVFKREDKNAEFRLRKNLSKGEADFNQFIRQRNQLVVAADIFLREQNLLPVLQSSLSKDLEEQLKLVHSSVLLVEMNCPLRIIKELSTLDNNFAIEVVLEKRIQTVHVLVVELECIQFL